MSLRVWLPLTKDLRNQGLSEVTVTNNGTTFDSAGKLGGCYYFNGSNNYLSTVCTNYPTIFSGDFSIAFWLYSNDDGTRSVYLGNYGLSGGGNWFNLEKNANNKVRIWWNNGSPNIVGTTEIKASEGWIHFCLTRSGNIFKIFKNGALDQTISNYTLSNNIPSTATTFYIGTDYRTSSDIVLKGKLNDYRIYDHALSPMEVKQISQGLVLHYPLDNNGFGNENLVLNSDTFATGSGASGITPSTTSDGLHQVIAASGNSNWHASWATSTATSLLENAFAEGDPFTISFTIKSENANKTNPPDIYVKSGMGYYSMQGSVGPNWSTVYYSGTWKDTNSISFHLGFSGRTGTYLFKNWKVEKGLKPTPWCPNKNDELATIMGMNDRIEYDCSGFGNNGTQNNLPTYSSDTAKYNASIHFDGVNQTVQLPNLTTLIPDSIFTFNIWFKRLESEPSSKPWETILGGPGGFELESCSANNVHDAKIKAYSWGGGNFAFEFDKWNMLTMVSNGTNALFYLNGELKLTGTYKALVSGNYFLGSWLDTSTQNYKGYMSDARIYATALSASDIQSLYQNSAYIDSSGNIYGAVHEEV